MLYIVHVTCHLWIKSMCCMLYVKPIRYGLRVCVVHCVCDLSVMD